MLDPLAGSLTPQPQAQAPDPQLKSEWDSWLRVPANNAAVLNFGLSLLAGGWGGTAGQLAQAAGKGVEAAVGTQQVIDQEEQRKQNRADKIADREDEQAFRRELENVSQKGANSRAALSAGQAKTQARWDRFFFKQDAARKAIEAKLLDLKSKIEYDEGDPESNATKQVIALEQKLANMEEPDAFADRMTGGQSAGAGADAGNATSAIPAGTEGAVVPPQPGQTPVSGQRGDGARTDNIGAQTPPAAAAPTKIQSGEFLKRVSPATVEAALKTEAGRAKLKEKVSDWYNIPGMVAPAKPVYQAPTRGGNSGVNSNYRFNNQ